MAKAVNHSGKTPHSSSDARGAAAAVDPVDGGAAPAAHAGSDANPVAETNDGGAPSAELVAAIAAAGGGSTSAASPDGLDGGPAPP